MGTAPAYSRVFSLHLSRTLEEVGLNDVTVKQRRQTYLFLEYSHTISVRMNKERDTLFHFGSQTEGTTTPGLGSDLDTLYCMNEFSVIQDWSSWGHGEVNLLMLQEDTEPGYCRLQVLRPDVPTAMERLYNEQCAYDSSGRVILKNNVVQLIAKQRVKNGPAVTTGGKPGEIECDFVCALKCKAWPDQAEEFTRRRRQYGWPSPALLHQATSHGVFLVPVGHKLSATEELEWRISASLTERCLMFSLSLVHLKCYVVLKMLVKTYVAPRVGKCISSYHCKTALLYTTENTEPAVWRDDNLLHCVNLCLQRLLIWLRNRFCPQFIIADEDLFAGKVTPENQDICQEILTSLVDSDGRALLGVRLDDLGAMLQGKLSSQPADVKMFHSLASVTCFGHLEYIRHNSIEQHSVKYLLKYNVDSPDSVIRYVYRNIVMLRDLFDQQNKHRRHAAQCYIKFLSTWLGSLLACVSLSRKTRIPRRALQLMITGSRSDVASMLKLASVLYCSGHLPRVEALLLKIEEHFYRNDCMVVCGCYRKPCIIKPECASMIYLLRGKTARSKLFVHCVIFSRHEMHCVPPALRHEFVRLVSVDIHHRVPEQDKWMNLAVVDCLPFLYFLQYNTYRQLGKLDHSKRSLYNLERCIKEDNDFRHLETAWNLLGQCQELEQRPRDAMTCYKTSLEIRPCNNAANWHVQNLRYTAIRSGAMCDHIVQ